MTAADIARSLGISRATVGFVLNSTPGQAISAATRERVLAEASRLGYRPNAAAQALASGRSRCILILLPDWPVGYTLQRSLDVAVDVLEQGGYWPVVHTYRRGERARPLWEYINPEVVVCFGLFDAEDLAAIRASGVRKVLPDVSTGPGEPELPLITAGPRRQVEHLYDLGHRRLAIATSRDPRPASLIAGRTRAARAAVAEFGMHLESVVAVDHRDGSAERAVEAWRAAGVTGVVAYNDTVAAVVLGAVVRAGLRVPAELAVVGHDNAPLAELFVPAISSVTVDTDSLARYLARMALHEADGRPAPTEVPDWTAQLFPRESTVAAGGI
ncbi:LacI family DNA-binding transcriptional regulator [Nocardia sp. NPDC059239]|uniref:LacI family DNA-binding transcriptional regulator n=1 Tax=unclassified Nocardia TaxID=2637762 RepID=UPI0036A73142